MRVLLVEDDAMIGRAVSTALRGDRYAVDWAADGEAAEAALSTSDYDMMLLDLGLPKTDGLTVLARTRRRGLNLPILIMSARDTVQSRVGGLDAGADDYLPKPFDLDELGARMRALLRRRHGLTDPVLEHAGVCLNPATREVRRDGVAVALTAREYALLHALLERPGTPLSRDQIIDKIYDWGDVVGSNTVEVYIHALRRKLGAEFIVNIRGVGYCLTSGNAKGVTTSAR